MRYICIYGYRYMCIIEYIYTLWDICVYMDIYIGIDTHIDRYTYVDI